MPIPFSCPHCQAETLVDDQYANQTGDCAICGREITVPALPATRDTPTPRSRPTHQSHRRSLITALVLSLGGLAAVAATFGILVWVALPVVQSNQLRSYRLQSNQHLQRIALAMRNYHNDHGSYPPAYVTDSNGRPMHSWRVLLLPYLDEHATYAQYDLSKPWDEQTLELQSPLRIPRVYTSPADADSTTFGHTSFVVITGKRTMFPGPLSTRSSQIEDGLAGTIMVVERHDSGIPWYQPRDLKSTQMQFQINGSGQEISSNHPGGAWLTTADGTTYFVRDSLSTDFVQSLTTIAGGERVPLEELSDDLDTMR
ncbi:MAG: DUF1559 domain-containing protein [Planctomycetota bacterium]|nr:DUF1559 domain-containing protein [Planctomycetota bacterium]